MEQSPSLTGAQPSATRERALVTGGTSGIGLEFARQLAQRGLDLVLVARNQERLESTAADLASAYGVDVATLAADLGTQEGIDRVKARLSAKDAPISVLINNAGHGLYEPLATENTRAHRQALDVMVWSVLELGAAAGVVMKKRGHGLIVTTASVSGLVPMGGYSAIKAWARQWSESLGLQLRPHGVRVVTFNPGWVRTEFHTRTGTKTSSIPDFLWLDAERAVRECLDAAADGKERCTPSKRYKVLSFLAQHAPKAAVHAVTRRIVKGRSS